MKNFTVAVCMVVVSACAITSADVVTLNPWTDGYITQTAEWNPYAYYSGSTYKQRFVYESNRAAFEFNIHEYKNKTITSAELQFEVTPVWGGYMDSVEIYQMPSNLSANRHDWDVATNGTHLLTWNNNSIINLDVTSQVQAALPGATMYDKGICFTLRSLYGHGQAGFTFGSDYAYEPKLQIEYIPEPATLTLLITGVLWAMGRRKRRSL